jgi:hypothetical protein
MALADYQALVDKMVRADATVIVAADRDAAIELARLRYSEDAVRRLTEDVVWAAEGYIGPLPASWVTGSSIVTTEYPIGMEPPEFLDMSVYVTPSAQELLSPDVLPAGAAVRVQFTAPHLLNAGSTPADTIPLKHREAVASYAAQILCRELASYYSGQRDTAIGADNSNGESRARNFSSRAREYRSAYYAGIGKADPQSDKGAGGATAGAGAASVSSWTGRGRLGLTRVSPP